MTWSGWRRAWLLRYAAAALIFVLATGVWLHGVVAHPGSRIPSGYSDATATLHDYWAASAQHRNPFDFKHDALNGAPQGFERTPAALAANAALQTAFVWSLRGPLGLVGAWNTFIFLGLFGTGMAMFALLDRLRCTFVAAIFAGLVFAFGPYSVERVEAGHLNLLQNWSLVLVLAALLEVAARRTLARAAALGAAIGLAFYLTAYLGLLASLMVLVFFAIEIVRPGGRGVRLRSAALGAFAYATALVLMIPIFGLYVAERSAVRATVGRPVSDLSYYAASLGSFLVPSPRNPLLRSLDGWQPIRWLLSLHPTDLTEQTLFFGYTTLAFAVVAAVLVFRRDARLKLTDARWRTAVFALVLAPVSFLSSFAPTEHLGGVPIPMPAWLLAQVTTYWRVYSRIGLLTELAAAILAALALTALAARRGRIWQIVPVLALAAVTLELLPATVPVFDTTARPQWVDWLASQPNGIVAAYPSLGPGAPTVLQQDQWYQQFDGKPRFLISEASPSVTLSRDQAIRFAARDLSDPLTARILSTEHVRYVVVYDKSYRVGGGEPPPMDPRAFTLLGSFPGVRIFSVHARPIDLRKPLEQDRFVIAQLEGLTAPSLDYQAGFNGAETYKQTTGRWLAGEGRVRIGNPDGAMNAVLSGLAFSNGRPRLLELVDSAGRVVARQQIPAYATPLALGPFPVPHGGSTMTLITVPGADPLGGSDPRTASVFLAGVELKPLPAYAGA
jgi:hypothetical protein